MENFTPSKAHNQHLVVNETLSRQSRDNHDRTISSLLSLHRLWKYAAAITLLLTLACTDAFGAEIFGFTCTSSTTAVNSYTAIGGTAALSGSAMATGGSNEITIGTQTFYKFNSSSQWTFTLSSGTFAVGDVISFTCACATSNKTGKGVKINNSIAVTGDFAANTANTISYTVVANDGIAGQSSFYIKRNDSDIKFGTISVTRTTAATYTVTYNGNSSDGGSVPTDASSPYASGSTVTVLGNTGSLTRTIDGSAATFYGWDTNSKGFGGTHYDAGGTFSITANTTLYAAWGFPLSYNTDGGTINNASYPDHYIYTGDETITATLPDDVTKSGFTFDGWYTGNGSGSKVTGIEGTYTGAFSGDWALKAKWVEEDGCDLYFWFFNEADQTSNGKTNATSVFSNMVAGSSNMSGSITIDEITYNVTRRSGDADLLGQFTIPANKIGTFYTLAVSSGDAARQIVLTNTSTSATLTEDVAGGSESYKRVQINDIPSGTYNIGKSGGNTRLGMVALKICDEEPEICAAPTSVTIAPTNAYGWRYSIGETISLDATPVGGTGTPRYQWQKYIDSDWENIAGATSSRFTKTNCTSSDGGSYRCIVTTGEGCSKESDSYWIRIFTLNGNYSGSGWTENAITWTGEYTGTVSLSLNQSSTYMFKVYDNDGKWFGFNANNYIIQPVALDCGTGNNDIRLFTGPAGTYTFTVNIQHAADYPEPPYVNIQVAYPEVSHPSSGYMYITKWWNTCYLHYWEGTNNALSTWGSDPALNSDRYVEICGTNYWYFPVIATYNKFIAKDAAGDPDNTTGDQVSTSHGGQYITHDGSWGWHDFNTYTISYAANGGGGSMSATNGICPNNNQTISNNAFTAPSGCASFSHWTANVNVTVGGETVTAGNAIANGATLQNINSNITLTAVWKLAAPTITDNGDNTFSISGSIDGASYYYTTNGSTPTTSSSVYSSAVDYSAGEADITAKAIAHKDGYVDSDVASQACVYRVCSISNCGNTTLTYPIYTSGNLTTSNLFSGATSTNPTAVTVGASPTFTGVTVSSEKKGSSSKAGDCYAKSTSLTGKMEYSASSKSSSYCIDFPFTVNEGYTFTPCDVQVVIQPVSNAQEFTVEITNGTDVYGASAATALAEGVMAPILRLTSTSAMPAGDYAIRLYPHGGNDKEFRMGADVILKGTTAYACEEATEITVSSSSANYDILAGGVFTEPTFTVKHGDIALDPQPTIIYSSSDEAVATVANDGTITFHSRAGSATITATFAGDATYCASEGSYTINVTCGGESAPKIVVDGSTNLNGCNNSITLHARQQDGNAFSNGTYQWYCDEVAISGATSADYTTSSAGIYTYIITHGGECEQVSTNRAVISGPGELMVETLAPFQYYHAGKTYSTKMQDRHLFAVTSHGLLDGKPYSMTATKGGSDVLASVSGALRIEQGAIIGVEQMPDTVMLDLNKLSSAGFSAGDKIQFTCHAIDCGSESAEVYDTITLRVIDDTPTLALICSSEGETIGGDFLEDYRERDLQEQTGEKAWSGEWPLYTYLKARYNITPVNGFADFNKLNYEPFDIALLTDFPKASVGTDAKVVLDDMAELCDYRPLLSFKTHMVQDGYHKWEAKGFTTNPQVPKTCQLRADIVCYAHPMFATLSTASADVNENYDNEAEKVFTLLSGEGYETGKVDGAEPKKGIQGFEVNAADNFVIIAYAHYNATPNDLTGDDAGKVSWTDKGNDRNLVAMCERQTNIEARMILFSLNAGAHSKLTDAGKEVVDSCLQYLLDTDPLHVSDCSLTFDNNTGNRNWSDALNWLPSREEIPHANVPARIAAPCNVDIANAAALNVRIEENGSLYIPTGSALTVVNTIKHKDGLALSPTSVDEIEIGSNEYGSGTLILNNNAGDTKASVQMYSKAQTDGTSTVANWKWQYIGTPFNDVTDATINYYQSWIYRWTGSGWALVPKASGLTPFTGYCITHPQAGHTYHMTGTLATTAKQTISVPAGSYMVVGNSWTAPIQIKNFEDGDLKNITDKSIYFFNTGSDPNGNGTVNENPSSEETRYASATYISVPIHAAKYVGDSIIPAMQGFYVVGGSEDGTLTLDYNKLVRPQKSWQNIVSGPMHAPRRIAAAEGEPTVAKLWVCGTNYDDRLVVLEREDFTRTYDSGWDGEKWEGNEISPMVYALNEDGGQEAVTATPDMEGTLIGFRAGEDDEYTFRFNYDGMAEPIYLLDTDTKVYTRVLTGNTYTFTTTDKAAHNRFILTRTEGNQVPTGWSNFTVEEDKVVKFINNGKLFIFVHGVLYDATGKVVR